MKIDLPPDLEVALLAAAKRLGETPDRLAGQVIVESILRDRLRLLGINREPLPHLSPAENLKATLSLVGEFRTAEMDSLVSLAMKCL